MWRTFVIWLASIVVLVGNARALDLAEGRPASKTLCVSAAETREEIKGHHLIEPFTALRSAQMQYKAEALSAKLCRVGEEYFYDIALLHRDGRFVHVSMNAVTGKWIDIHRLREASPHDTAIKSNDTSLPKP